MGNKIKLTDTSGNRFPKKPKANQADLISSDSSLSVVTTTNSNSPVGGGGTPGGISGSIQFNESGALGGVTGFTFDNTYISLNVGCENIINGCNSAIIGGGFSLHAPGPIGSVNSGHTISSSFGSVIIGGGSIYGYGLPNQISNGEGSTIIGSISSCTMHAFGSSIVGTSLSCIFDGNHNTIIGSNEVYSYHDNTIFVASSNNINLNHNNCIAIIGAVNSCMGGAHGSVIIGGDNNSVCESKNSVIIGGNGLTLSGDNTVMVPQLNIASLPIGDPGIPGNVYITGTTPPIQLFVSGLIPSDFRFKNILKKLYTTPEGINVYSYIYKNFVNMEGIFQGVIAQELIGSPFEYALEKHGGYYYVNYYKLPDVEFKRID